jgi:spore maturation protein CgeB
LQESELYLKTLKNLKHTLFPTYIQEEKYSSDISWIGNPFKVPNKNKTVKFIAIENFPLKIFFNVQNIIKEVEPMMREYVIPINIKNIETINLIIYFSEIIVNESKNDICNILTSAYLNGFHITNYNSNYEKYFKMNNENELPNTTHELIVYRNLKELEILLDYLLEHKELRTQINNNLKKRVEKNFIEIYNEKNIEPLIKEDINENI